MANRQSSWIVYWHSLRLQVRSAMSLRGAFALQIIGMIINNLAITIAWLFLFHQFGTINGWQAQELIGFEGINMVVFAIPTERLTRSLSKI